MVSLLPLPNNVEDKVGRDWFLPVIHRESKLTQEHMDAIPHLLVLDFQPHEAPRVRNWTFLDFKCWVALIQPHYDDCRETLSPYVSGRLPTTGSLAWKDAERIFGVGDLGSNHWILYEILRVSSSSKCTIQCRLK
ncbi:AP2/B3-like transcriptional factor family protein [Perilla frutescens var. frutescens]|nr:AP2/B3-like transcriptional factor family protein [Perilla frutescens var. frutescens]